MIANATDARARAELSVLLTPDDLVRLLQVDRRTVRRLCLKGKLPMPLKLGGGNRWLAGEVYDAIDALSAGRGQAETLKVVELVN